jgi:hypothetical protein
MCKSENVQLANEMQMLMDLNQFTAFTVTPNVKKELFCGGYRSRTDDPLRARQML